MASSTVHFDRIFAGNSKGFLNQDPKAARRKEEFKKFCKPNTNDNPSMFMAASNSSYIWTISILIKKYCFF